MDFKAIDRAAKLMKKNNLSELSYEEEGIIKISLKMGGTAAPMAMMAPVEANTATTETVSPVQKTGTSVDSPLVGTFYSASSPNTDPYIKVGDTVTEDTVVCIIEAMKVMNEIKAETSGVVQSIMVENGMAVEYGQTLIRIK